MQNVVLFQWAVDRGPEGDDALRVRCSRAEGVPVAPGEITTD